MTDVLGWACSFLLLLTLAKQVHKEAKARSTEGVSKLLFIGQLITSIGFTVYSYLVGNWVFVFTNFMLIITSLIGIYFYFKFADTAEGNH